MISSSNFGRVVVGLIGELVIEFFFVTSKTKNTKTVATMAAIIKIIKTASNLTFIESLILLTKNYTMSLIYEGTRKFYLPRTFYFFIYLQLLKASHVILSSPDNWNQVICGKIFRNIKAVSELAFLSDELVNFKKMKISMKILIQLSEAVGNSSRHIKITFY